MRQRECPGEGFAVSGGVVRARHEETGKVGHTKMCVFQHHADTACVASVRQCTD